MDFSWLNKSSIKNCAVKAHKNLLTTWQKDHLLILTGFFKACLTPAAGSPHTDKYRKCMYARFSMFFFKFLNLGYGTMTL